MRGAVWFLAAGLSLVSLVGAPLVHSFIPLDTLYNAQLRNTKEELFNLGLGQTLEKEAIADLVEYRRVTGKNLAQVLKEQAWSNKLGLSAGAFKATWYISNPFDLLPKDLQAAIRAQKTPFKSRAQVWDWCRARRAPNTWKKALKAALVETTPYNLWRASRGQKPYAKNGEFLQPIVVEKGQNVLEVRHGHIATDPRIIPTGTTVFLVVKINGQERILKVKAADIGGGIKGRHVDLPITLNPANKGILPDVRLPRSQIGNPTVQILIPTLSKKKA